MADFKRIWTRVANGLTQALFPTKCLVCGKFFPPPQRNDAQEDIRNITYQTAMASCLCPTCITGFSPITSPLCPTCGTMFKKRDGQDRVCNTCLTSPKRFGKARALGAYKKEGDMFATVIRRFKYTKKTQLARPLEKLLFATFARWWNKDEIDLVMPVPLHIKRFRKRGFNQAYLVIRHWPRIARDFHIERTNMRIERDVLFKIRPTKPQASLKGRERIKNPEQAFTVRHASKIKEKRILLVDDVYTTGSTVNECTKELLRNGAKSVDILTLARTL